MEQALSVEVSHGRPCGRFSSRAVRMPAYMPTWPGRTAAPPADDGLGAARGVLLALGVCAPFWMLVLSLLVG